MQRWTYPYDNFNGTAYTLGTNMQGTYTAPAWTDKMHQKNGNLLICDGSARQLSSSKLRDQLKTSGDTTTTGMPAPTTFGSGNVMLFP